jgi:acyl carrier protein
MEKKVKEIMGKIFEINAEELNEKELNVDQIEAWDSLTHLMLITSLQEEFDLEIPIENIATIRDFQTILLTIEKYKVK